MASLLDELLVQGPRLGQQYQNSVASRQQQPRATTMPGRGMSGLNAITSRYSREQQAAAKAQAKAQQEATATAGDVITAIELPEGTIRAQAPSGAPYLVRKPGSSTILRDPVSGEELAPDVMSPTGLTSITAQKKEEAKAKEDALADKLTERSRVRQAQTYDRALKGVEKDKQAAQKQEMAGVENQYLAQGRKYFKDRTTGEPIPLQTDEEFQAERQAKLSKVAEESRAKQLKNKVTNLNLDEETIKLERNPPSEAEYRKMKDELSSSLPYGFVPTEEALAGLEQNPETAPIAARTRELTQRIKDADEANAAITEIARKRLDIQRQLANPDQWAKEETERLTQATDAELDERMKIDSDVIADLDNDIEIESAPIKARNDQLQAEYDAAYDKIQNAATGEERIAAQRDFDRAQYKMSVWEAESAEPKAALEESYKLRNQRAEILNNAQTIRHGKAIAERKEAIGGLAQVPALKPIADKIQKLDEDEATRLADIETNVPEDQREFAKASLAQDIEAKRAAVNQELVQANAKVQKDMDDLYEKFKNTDFSLTFKKASDADKSIVSNDEVLGIEAEAKGLNPEQVREYVATRTALDWTAPLKLGKDGTGDFSEEYRTLPNGDINLNPRFYLDETEYQKAVERADASPEAKAKALSMRRELAMPYAQEAIKTLEKDSQLSEWLDKNTKGNPLERIEKFNEEFKKGGFLESAYTRFRAGAGGLASSGLGVLAFLTGDEDFTNYAQAFRDHSAAYEMAGEASGRGTNAVGRFASKVIGAVPSVAPAIVTGVATGGLGFGATTALNASVLASGLQSLGGTYMDSYQTYKDNGLSDTEARAKSIAPAIVSGLITGLVTRAGGATGIESLFRENTEEAIKTGLKAAFMRVLPDATKEGVEEFSDQALQGMLGKLSFNPDKPISEAFNEAVEAGLIGMALGGGVTAVNSRGQSTPPAPGESPTPEPTIPEVPAPGEPVAPKEIPAETKAVIDANIKSFKPEPTSLPAAVKTTAKDKGIEKASREAVTAIMAVAQGASLDSLPSGQLEALGLQRTEKGIVQKDKKVSPLVEVINGNPVIRDEAIEFVSQNGEYQFLRDQIGKTESERIAEINTPKPKPQPEPTPAKKPRQKKGAAVKAKDENKETKVPGEASQKTVQSTQPNNQGGEKPPAPEPVSFSDGGRTDSQTASTDGRGNAGNAATVEGSVATKPELGKAPQRQRKAIGKGMNGRAYAEFASELDTAAFTYAGNLKEGRNESQAARKRRVERANAALAQVSRETGISENDLRPLLSEYSQTVRDMAKAVPSEQSFQAPTFQEFVASKTLPPASQAQEEGSAGIVTQSGEGSILPVTEDIVTPAQKESSAVIETENQKESPSVTVAKSLGVSPKGQILKDGFTYTRIKSDSPEARKLDKREQRRFMDASKALVETIALAEKIKGVNFVISDDPEIRAISDQSGNIIINPRAFAQDIALAAKDVTKSPKQAVVHELIHEMAARRIGNADYLALWDALPAALKKASVDEYTRNAPEGTAEKLNDMQKGAEFFAQLIEARLKGELASQMWDSPSLAKRVIDMVREYIAALRDLSKLIPDKGLRDIIDNTASTVENDLRAALKEAGIEQEFLPGRKRKSRVGKIPPVQTVMPDGAELTEQGPNQILSLPAYHGTPHKVDKFRLDKIGTGEGAQAYGHGLYFAESEEVAKSYADAVTGPKSTPLKVARATWLATKDENIVRKRVSQIFPRITAGEIEDALKQGQAYQGNLYTVELLPDESEFLDWDKPLSEQKNPKLAALKKQHRAFLQDPSQRISDKSKNGDSLYHMLSRQKGSDKAASDYLASIGIPGIKYLDGGSRSKGDGTRNYVIFDESLVRILEENGQPVSPQPLSLPSAPSELDAAYLKAVESGDMATAQKMVDEAAKRAGYDVRAKHGTASKFTSFDKKMGGKMTDALSAKDSFFFTDDDKTAMSYAVYAAEDGPVKEALAKAEAAEKRGDWNSYDKFTQLAESLDSYDSRLKLRKNATIIDAYIKGDFLEFDAKGKTPQELHDGDIDAGISAEIKRAKKQGKTGVVYRNLDDAINLSNRPATHYAVFKPSQIKSADPVTRDADGNVIPLSQRFNPKSDSILYLPAAPNPESLSPVSPTSNKGPATDAEDQANIRRITEDAAADEELRKDPKSIKALADKRSKQTPGKKLGDPKIANIGVTERGRDLYAAQSEARALNGREISNREAVYSQARETLAADPKGVETRLMEMMEKGQPFGEEDTALAAILYRNLERELNINPGNTELEDRLVKLGFHFREARAEAGRNLGIIQDPMMTPTERFRDSISAVKDPPAPLRAKILRTWTTLSKDKEIKRLEKLIADVENDAQLKVLKTEEEKQIAIEKLTESYEAQLEEARSKPTRDDLLKQYAEENKARVQEVLDRMGLTNDDVMLDPQDRYSIRETLLESPGIKSAMASYTQAQKSAVTMALNGYSDEIISQRTGLKPDATARLIENFRQNVLKPAIASEVRQGKTFASLLKDGYQKLRNLLSLPATGRFEDLVGTGEITAPNAAAIESEINRILDFTMQPARKRNRPGSLVAKVVPLKNGQKVRMYIPFDPEDANSFYRYARELSTRDSTAFDKGYEYWINGILSGIQTQVANISGNAAQIAWNYTFQRGAEALLNVAYKDPNAAQLGEFPYVFKAFYKAVGPAWNQAKLAWSTEADVTRTEYLNEPLTADFKDSALDKVGGQRAAIAGRHGRIIRIPGRALRFFDSLFKTAVLHAEATAVAYRQAKKAGYSGDALEAFMTERLQERGSAVWQEAMAESERLLFQDSNWATDAAESFVRGKTRIGKIETDIANAEAAGDNKKAAELQKSLRSAQLVAALMKYLFPFVRTPTNILRVGARKSGGAAIAGLYNVANGLYQMKNGKPFLTSYTKAAQIKDLSESLLAGIAWAGLMGMAEGDDDDDKKMILIVGNRPYGIGSQGDKAEAVRKYGGTQVVIIRDPSTGQEVARFNYGRYEPFATALGVIVDTLRSIKRSQKSEDGMDVSKTIGLIGGHLMAQAEGKSFLQGLSGLARTGEQIAEGKFDPGPSIGKAIVSGIVPNIIRQTMRNLDDYQRDYKSGGLMHEAFPSGQFAEPAIGPGGEPIKKSGSPLSRLLVQVPNAPSKPTAEREIQNYNLRNPGNRIERNPLTKAQYFAYAPDGKTKIVLEDPKDKTLFQQLYEKTYERNIAQGVAANPAIRLPKPPLKTINNLEDINSKSLRETRERFYPTKVMQGSLNSAK